MAPAMRGAGDNLPQLLTPLAYLRCIVYTSALAAQHLLLGDVR